MNHSTLGTDQLKDIFKDLIRMKQSLQQSLIKTEIKSGLTESDPRVMALDQELKQVEALLLQRRHH